MECQVLTYFNKYNHSTTTLYYYPVISTTQHMDKSILVSPLESNVFTLIKQHLNLLQRNLATFTQFTNRKTPTNTHITFVLLFIPFTL